METHPIRDLMVPLSAYATVPRTATLCEAVDALERAQDRYTGARYKHRAILVLDEAGEVVGKLSLMDVVRAIDPDLSGQMGEESLTRFGISDDYLDATLRHHHVWQKPLSQLCAEAAGRMVADIMYTPVAGEYIDIDETLPEAIQRLVLGQRHSLLVKDGDRIAGVLRLTDIFATVCATMQRVCRDR